MAPPDPPPSDMPPDMVDRFIFRLFHPRVIVPLAVALIAAALLMGAKGCPSEECQRLKAAAEAVCKAAPDSQSCAELRRQAEACGLPVPTPTPPDPPPPETCATKVCAIGQLCAETSEGPTCYTPQPPPDPQPKCEPGQNCGCHAKLDVTGEWALMSCTPPRSCVDHVCQAPTPADACPKPLEPGSRVYMRANYYGQGLDSTVRVEGDPGFCFAIHGELIRDCHLEGWKGPTGSDDTARVRCEMQLLGGCPVWQYSVDDGKTWAKLSDDHHAMLSADHFGNVVDRDDPQTPTSGTTVETLRGFEGRPLECGLQRDEHGPMAGFFAIAHGKGQVRACRPDWQECSPGRAVDK